MLIKRATLIWYSRRKHPWWGNRTRFSFWTTQVDRTVFACGYDIITSWLKGLPFWTILALLASPLCSSSMVYISNCIGQKKIRYAYIYALFLVTTDFSHQSLINLLWMGYTGSESNASQLIFICLISNSGRCCCCVGALLLLPVFISFRFGQEIRNKRRQKTTPIILWNIWSLAAEQYSYVCKSLCMRVHALQSFALPCCPSAGEKMRNMFSFSFLKWTCILLYCHRQYGFYV